VFRKSTPLSYYGQSAQSWLASLHAPAFSMTCALALMPGVASATLGEKETTVQGDAVRLRASLRATPAAAFTVHELTLPTGTIVREFVNAAGTVFAVSWRGPSQPDLQSLLGSYFDTYAKAPRSAGSDRSHLGIDQSNLVVRAGGRQRAFVGLAFVPQLIPQGVSAADLQ
jgi:hypothetical protein